MSKESFKIFVKNNPSLIDYVKNNEMTWQSFYELYDLYGENDTIWNKYLNKKENNEIKESKVSLLGDTSLKDLFNMLKNVDMDSVKKGVDSLQKAVGIIQGITSNKNNQKNSDYKRRPMYKYFED